MHDKVADLALVGLSCGYAAWLARHKELEPGWTWVEVGVGCAYCLAHAYIRAQHSGGDWRYGWSEAARSLMLGGVPIAAGEVTQWLQSRAKVRDLARKWG